MERRGDLWIGRFAAMASPCELQLELADGVLADTLLRAVADEARRMLTRALALCEDDPEVHAEIEKQVAALE